MNDQRRNQGGPPDGGPVSSPLEGTIFDSPPPAQDRPSHQQWVNSEAETMGRPVDTGGERVPADQAGYAPEEVVVEEPVYPKSGDLDMNPAWYQAMNNVCVHIKLTLADEAFKTFVLTGARRGEGTTTVTAQLGRVMATIETGRVLIVDADIENPGAHKQFGLSGRPGLTDVLKGDINLDQAVSSTGQENLFLLPAGGPANETLKLFSPEVLEKLTTLAQAYFTHIFVDAPPVLIAPHTEMLIQSMDHVLVVVRANYTRREVARRAIEKVGNKDKVLGMVFNQREMVIPASVYRLIK